MIGGRTARRLAASVATIAATVGAARAANPPWTDASVGAFLTRSRGTAVDRLAGAVTDAGSVYGLGAAATALLLAGHPLAAGRVLVAGGSAWTAAQGAKTLFDRRRPYELGIAERLVRVADAALGRTQGGLGQVDVVPADPEDL